ncbi:MAG: ribonuclease Y [Propionibacteriaceae bacterium]|jgi:ribonuclease Y|nr:ribonuclease Y [Propionibacteriaceae bacterium]
MNESDLLMLVGVLVCVVLVAVVVLGIIFVRNSARAPEPSPARSEQQSSHLDLREQRLDEREDDLRSKQEALAARTLAVEEEHARIREELSRVSGISEAQAKEELLKAVRRSSRLQAAALARDIEAEARRKAEYNAKLLIIEAIQRLASEQTAESVVATVPLPSDEMKGRIIGREGRNIRVFEQLTGVNVMVDDSPESVVISCFDPKRREAARIALADLVADGRIYPARIEEAVERANRRVDEEGMRAAEDVLMELGITDIDPGMMPSLAALHYRTSYGQNVLAHSKEAAQLAAIMAAELGLNVETCRRAAFLHDIGKSVSQEVGGAHAQIGAEIAKKHGEHPDIVHAIAAHHNEVEPRTVEALITQAADAMSGGRPGARRESLEAYIKRITRLEEIAAGHPGVDKAFSMQAGREVRVMVLPDQVDDAEAEAIAREIAQSIETELTYPGSIKVTVVRESRATATAK